MPRPKGDGLAAARQLYNQGRYDEAIAAATAARQEPAWAASATVVLARAHLERYRQRAQTADLDDARALLNGLRETELPPLEHREWVIGLGEALYFDDQFSAAADVFDLALGHIESLDPEARDRLFEWWAGALGQQAERGSESERRSTYARIVTRAEDVLRRDDRSAAASYWLAAAARGANDLDRAWGAALAGWVRAPLTGPHASRLRADLDRFVTLVLIPERARQLTGPGDQRPAAALLLQQWEELKLRYGSAD